MVEDVTTLRNRLDAERERRNYSLVQYLNLAG